MNAAAIHFRWDGEAMVPLPRFARVADRQFVIGEEYELVEHHERSSASHRHLFALIKEAWINLPERDAERFPSAEHLRKYALIKAGHVDVQTIACSSQAEALRWAEVMRRTDPYSLVVVSAGSVAIYTAKSISGRSLDKADFQKVKERALGVLAELIGADPAELGKAA